jgi:hypothetical protein
VSYRDAEFILRDRRDELLALREAELDDAWPDVSRIYARRAGRIAAGAFATCGAAWLVVSALVRYAEADATSRTLTPILLCTVALVPFAYALGWVAARLALRGARRKGLSLTGNVFVDLARLDHDERRAAVTHRANRLEHASVAATLVGWALLAPLSLHLLVAAAFSDSWVGCVRSFDGWIDASLVLTGIAHLTLALLGWRFANKLRGWDHESHDAPKGGWAAWGWTILASCVPGIIAFAIPPLIVAVTGAVFIPATYSFMRSRISDERHVLAALRTRPER